MQQDEGIDSADAFRAHKAVRGRGTGELAKGRFERLEHVYEAGEARQVATEVFIDRSRRILSTNDSPDVGFNVTLNPYRGCEHGCIYCYARPTHEYFGLSAGLDFETKLFAKTDAPMLLREALSAKGWVPQAIGISGVTDCYQPVERELKLTRGCLEVLAECRNPVVLITKNALVVRDIDLLAELSRHQAAHVVLSITTLDGELARKLEPRASQPGMRLKALEQLRKAGISAGINMAPIIPGLTEHEIPAILKRAADAGAVSAHYTMVRLPYGVKDLFAAWLAEHYPDKRAKVLNRIREMRGGKLNDASFGKRMEGEGLFAQQIGLIFARYAREYGLDKPRKPLSAAGFRKPQGAQLALF